MSRTKTIALRDSISSVMTLLFIAANIGLPHLFHMIPGGGIMFLPIYFFTAVAAVLYGRSMGMFTALMSPLMGYLIFGAPRLALIPDMMLKGVLLSLFITILLSKCRSVRYRYMAIPAGVVSAWAVAGIVEWPFSGLPFAFQDFFTGIPGLCFMTIGGWIALFINKRIA